MVRRSRPGSLNEKDVVRLLFKPDCQPSKQLPLDREIDVEVQEHPVKILEEMPLNSMILFSY